MDQVTKYFNAEKSESLIFIITGIIAVIFSLYFLFKVKTPFYTGMTYPLIGVALIQIIVGTSVYFRSPKDILRVNTILREVPTNIKVEDIPRMEKVMKNFVIYRWIEISLLVAGIILILFTPISLCKGAGTGLIIQSSLVLVLDYFAEERGNVYLDFLYNL